MTKSDDEAVANWPTEVVMTDGRHALEDPVVVEDPLQIRIGTEKEEALETLGITMRTPGADRELALGFLFGERVIGGPDEVLAVQESDDARPLHRGIDVRLAPECISRIDSRRLLLVTSACGVCGKSAVDAALEGGVPPLPPGPSLALEELVAMMEAMRRQQATFDRTGGLHAAALFTESGELITIHEDVGRHNAVDKVVGERLLAGELPVGESVMTVSGRLGFEIVQKAARAGVPFLAAVGAPTSLSLRLAARVGMTVVGFLRRERGNVYTEPGRLVA
ncbi:MAG: formate dehydrogenase accessory sulfurtransferase FdhD [Thermoanaerobaculia bacterium]|nr:formate dehydrogenase accessory sulfurtransferase FdhD [Thermoanaerobaculia bacterium]